MGLKELRTARKLTQRELAEKVGVSQGRIADWERGSREVSRMSLDIAIRLANALKVRDLRKLLDSDES